MKLKLVIIVATLILAALPTSSAVTSPVGVAKMALPAPSHDDGPTSEGTWSWNTATHPAGSAAVAGGTSGGGVWKWGDIYYVPGVGHMDELTQTRNETAPTGSGMLGKVSHSTGANQERDLGLIATGTTPLKPHMRVSNAWRDAPISDVAHDVLPKGTIVCHSGTALRTQELAGYRCGELTNACVQSSGDRCFAKNDDGLVDGGDSGGPVWYYDGTGGVILYGWVVGGLRVGDATYAPDGTYRYMHFEPVWNLQNKVWTVDETWLNGGYPAGTSKTACFVTTQGCIRS